MSYNSKSKKEEEFICHEEIEETLRYAEEHNQGKILWQQDRAVRAAVSFKLLHQWL